MKKRLLSAALAVCMLFGSAAALPDGFLGESTVITASAAVSDGYTYSVLSDGTADITGAIDHREENVTLPSLLDGHTVTAIGKPGGGNGIFTSTTKPTNGITTVLTIPDTVILINPSAIRCCTALSSVIMSQNVKTIGTYAFDLCASLPSIDLPASLTSIDKTAFDGCTSLESINVEQGCANYSSFDGVLYNKAQTSILIYPPAKMSVEFPGTLKTIPVNVFKGELVNAVINVGTTEIKSAAFASCPNMKSITIPRSVTTIGSHAVGYYRADVYDDPSQDKKLNDLTICCYPGSAAETYAKSNGFAIEYLPDICEHEYGKPEWTWSGYSSAKATFTCSKCGNSKATESVNSTNEITVPATCSTTGIRTYTVTVGFGGNSYTDQKTQIISKSSSAHLYENPVWTWTSDTSATLRLTCKYNSAHVKTVTKSASTKTIAATCTEPGKIIRTVSTTIDGVVYTDTKEFAGAAALGHNYGSWQTTTPATCTTNGVKTRKCTRSGCTATETETIPSVGHKYSDKVIAPTCTQQGYTRHTCSQCKAYYDDTYVDPTGHKWGTWTASTKATCLKGGTETRKCSVCSTAESRQTAALGHNYIESVTAPSCTTRGFTRHTCSRCSSSYDDAYTNVLGHNWVTWVTESEPTCIDDGSQVSTCTRCSEKTRRKVDKLGHDYVVTVVAPTCTQNGYSLHKCSRCSDFYKTDETAPTGHKWSSWIVTKPATCDVDGEETRSCSVCQTSEKRKAQSSGHIYKDNVVAPTCTEKGYTQHTCTSCGYSYKDNFTAMTEHSWGEWTVDKEPTCTAAGTKIRKCSSCGGIQSSAVEALGHNYSPIKVAPTCTAQGFTMNTCTRCGDNYKSNYVDPIPHSYTYWQVTKQPTCTQTGEQSRTCLVCKNVDTQYINALGHDYSATMVMPTCTEQGYTVHECSRCTDKYTDTYTDALGHDYKTWVRTTEPTCLTDGEEKSTCTRCSAKTTRTVKKLGHNYKQTVIAPTCTENGYTLNKCTRCEDFYKTDETDALGHSWGKWKTETAATCTLDGTQKHVCTRTGCTASETRKVNKLGHSYQGAVMAATCTEKGFTTYICSRCKDSYVDDYTDALGHSFGSWKTTKKETCTADGLQTRSCTRTGCTETESRVRTKLGHNYVDTVVAPTCTEQGYTLHKCSRCTDNYADTYTDAKGHNWGSWKTTIPATATQEGEQQRKCQSCSAVEKKVIPMLGHHYAQTVTKPTCTTQGYTTFRCTDCGHTYEGNYVEPLGHSYKTDRVIAPTCTEKGYTIEKCERCGITRNEDYQNELGHSFGKWQTTTPATCTTNGVKTRKCTRTGCKASETDVIVSLGHQYSEKVIAPTCTENGCTEYTCSVCNHSYQDKIVSALGHDYGGWTTVKPASCLEDGMKSCTCRRKGCGSTQTQTINKLGHDYSNKQVVAPTCTEDGYTLYSCTRCSDFYKSDKTNALGHKFGKWSTKVAATCEKDGSQTRTCSVCKTVETRTAAKLGHNYTAVVKAPTCTEKGCTTYTCTRCSVSYDDNYKDALGHQFGEWKTTTAPTCETDGTQTCKCSRCSEMQTSAIAALGHDFKKTKTVKPTCTEKGYSVYKCSRCSNTYNDKYTDALGHKFGEWTTVEATVTKQGSNTRKCSTCGQTEVTVLPKLSIRVYGTNRYDTAFRIADRVKKENGGQPFKYVIIASGTDYADALSASYLSRVRGYAPILITSKPMNQQVADYIRKNAASNATIYIVGGKGAVTADMETKLKGFTCKRLAGSNRYGTNLAVLKEAGVSGGEILIASGLTYADALSASAVGKPILLVAGKSLTTDQKNYLQKTARCTSAAVIGGTGAVKAELEKDVKSIIKNVSRLGGASRYETSVMVARKYFSKPATISLAYGLNYPDGLCGGPLAMTYNCPLILTADKSLDAAKKYASEIKAENTVTFGGPALISDKSLSTILGK